MRDLAKVVGQVAGLVLMTLGIALYITYYQTLQNIVATVVLVIITLAACGSGVSRAALRYQRRQRQESGVGEENAKCVALSPWAEFKYDLVSLAGFGVIVAIGAFSPQGLSPADLVQGGAAFVALMLAKRTLLMQE